MFSLFQSSNIRHKFPFQNKHLSWLPCPIANEELSVILNASVMVILDAQRFGLSQLHQLRGRVGRSARVAYAFLMYKRDRLLSSEAEKRLSANVNPQAAIERLLFDFLEGKHKWQKL